MSPSYGCILCGYHIRDHETSEGTWLKEFRAIYSNPQGCFISGVGIYEDLDGDLQAPSDPKKRCDDKDYDPQLTKDFYITTAWDDTRTFICHEACWKLFEEAFKPNDVPLKRFFDVCESLPSAPMLQCFHWGHTYGGIYSFNNKTSYPWKCDLVIQPSDEEAFRYVTENPYDIPELSELMMETAHDPPNSEEWFNDKSNDCFGDLPWEIREAIAYNLTTHDALSLRESSRSFLPLLSSSTFWASRFRPGAERGFLFEKPNTAEVRDWLSLYRRTSSKQSSPGLRNRIRIWHLIDYVSELINLSLTHDEFQAPSRPYGYEANLIEAAANIVQRSSADETLPVLRDGCRAFWTLQTSFPHDLENVVLSFVKPGNHSYLTGISFNSKDGHAIQLGYQSANTVRYKVKGLKDLRGLVLAIDPYGIRAVKIVNSDGDRSQWFGTSNNTPITECLAVLDTTKALHIIVDGYKIISIAASVPENISSQSTATETSLSLRDKALWYPSVPPRELCLNGHSFIGESPLNMGYCPVHWVHFGGPQGSNFGKLIDISMDTLEYASSIKFHYTQEGLHKQNYYHFGVHEKPGVSQMIPHSINGPGGETIQSVQAAICDNIVCALKLITNRGQIFECGTTAPPPPIPPFPGAPVPPPEPEAQFEPLQITSGAAITGFYAAHDYFRFLNFGIVSEVIKRKRLDDE